MYEEHAMPPAAKSVIIGMGLRAIRNSIPKEENVMLKTRISAALFAAIIVNLPTVAAADEWKDPLNNGSKLVHEQFAEPTAVRLSDTVTALVIPQGDDTNVVVLSNGERISACRDWSAAHPDESSIGTWGLVDFLVGNDPVVLAQLNQMVANQAF